jgi:hypothetical protein
MANINEYICWRGDLTFEQSPFNEVDGLILAYLAYVPFDGIVTSPWEEDRISIREASELFWEQNQERSILNRITLTKMAPFVMRRLAQTRRFGNLKLCYYQNSVDLEEESQFSALCMEMPDASYIAYRGTDNSLIGWKENFRMSYQVVPAQRKAAEYLNYVSRKLKGDLITGGHSKGGNLATYGAAMARREVRYRIKKVYNYDGPGFMNSFLQSMEYQNILDIYCKLVPVSSMVGMLLGHDEHYRIVESEVQGVRQHDPLYWRVVGTTFSKVPERTRESYQTEKRIRNCLNDLDSAERERIINLIFGAFQEEELLSMDELRHMFQTRRSREAWLITHRKLQDNPDIQKLMQSANREFLPGKLIPFLRKKTIFLRRKGNHALISDSRK